MTRRALLARLLAVAVGPSVLPVPSKAWVWPPPPRILPVVPPPPRSSLWDVLKLPQVKIRIDVPLSSASPVIVHLNQLPILIVNLEVTGGREVFDATSHSSPVSRVSGMEEKLLYLDAFDEIGAFRMRGTLLDLHYVKEEAPLRNYMTFVGDLAIQHSEFLALSL